MGRIPNVDNALPSAYAKPIEKMKGGEPERVQVIREGKVADVKPEPLQRLYRPGLDRQPIRTVHEDGHVGIMRNSAESLSRKIHRKPAQLSDIAPEDRARCVEKDGKVFYKGGLVTIAHKDDVAAKRQESKARAKLQSDPIGNLARRLTNEQKDVATGFSKTKNDQPISQGDPFVQTSRTTVFSGEPEVKTGALTEE